jgi:hypothetical protein
LVLGGKEVRSPWLDLNEVERKRTYMGRIGWATRLLYMISQGKPSIGVEVGIFEGVFSIGMLSSDPHLKWYGVDPYTREWCPKRKQPVWDKIYEEIMEKFVPFGDRFKLIRKPSHEGVWDILNGVDFVFIDGDHRYTSVLGDIVSYEKKVRSGGILSGHDYYKLSVSCAVHDYLEGHNRNLQVEKEFDPCQIFWWEVP